MLPSGSRLLTLREAIEAESRRRCRHPTSIAENRATMGFGLVENKPDRIPGEPCVIGTP